MEQKIKNAGKEVALAAVSATAFYLFAAAIFAVIVKHCTLSELSVAAVSWCLKGLGAFTFSLIFVHMGRAFFKGAAAGALFSVLALFLFAAIGGGFYLTALFPAELLFSAALGGLGAVLGVKLRKEG